MDTPAKVNEMEDSRFFFYRFEDGRGVNISPQGDIVPHIAGGDEEGGEGDEGDKGGSPDDGGILGKGEGTPKAGDGEKPELDADGNPIIKDSDNKSGDGDKGAPESYEDFTLPEGMELDEGMRDNFLPMAKEMGLSQEKAQKLVTMYAEQMKSGDEARQTAFEGVLQEQMTELKNDPEFGGEKFDENVGVVRKAIEYAGGQELRDALDETGMGNHPTLVKAFWKIGKTISEDNFRSSSGDSGDKGEPKSKADILYGPDPNKDKAANQ